MTTRERDPALIWAVVSGLFCIALVASQLAGKDGVAAASKMMASAGFVTVAMLAGAAHSAYGRWILAGLVLSWCGDAFLLGTAEPVFLAGLVSFLAAHVAYSAAFVRSGVRANWLAAAAAPIAIASLGVSIWLAPFVGAGLVWPVRAYTLVISVMLLLAFGARGAGASALVPAGALLFYLSDLSVAAGRFVAPEFPNYVWGLPAYYAGQLLLALSVRQSAHR